MSTTRRNLLVFLRRKMRTSMIIIKSFLHRLLLSFLSRHFGSCPLFIKSSEMGKKKGHLINSFLSTSAMRRGRFKSIFIFISLSLFLILLSVHGAGGGFLCRDSLLLASSIGERNVTRTLTPGHALSV